MSAVVITRPSQPWGYVITLGTKTYPGPLNRRRVLPEVVDYYPIYLPEDTVYESGVYLESINS